MVRERYPPEKRKSQIIQAAFDLAVEEGFHNITRGAVAERCSCATSLITHYLGSTGALASAVMEKALVKKEWSILAAGIVLNHPSIKTMSEAMRQQALIEGALK